MGRRRVSPKPCAPSHLSSHTGRRCPATGTDQGAWGAGGPRPEQSVTQSVTVLTRRTTFCTQGEVPGQDGTGKFPKTARRREGRRLKEGRAQQRGWSPRETPPQRRFPRAGRWRYRWAESLPALGSDRPRRILASPRTTWGPSLGLRGFSIKAA